MPSRAWGEHLLNIYTRTALYLKLASPAPGFINFTLSQTCLIQPRPGFVALAYLRIDTYPATTTVCHRLLIPNLAKEMHVEATRSTIIGDTS